MPTQKKEVNKKEIKSNENAPKKVTVKVTEISQHALQYLNSQKMKKVRKILFRTFFLSFAAIFFVLALLNEFWFQLEFVEELKHSNNLWSKLFWSASYIIIVLTVLYLLSFIMHVFSGGSKKRKTMMSMLNSFIRYIGYLVMVVLVLSVWGVNTAALIASVGILGLVIGLGAQSLVSDILNGIFLVFEDTIQVGDIITYQGFRGEVIAIGIRVTKTKSTSGDINVINNSELRNFVNMSKHRSLATSDITIAHGENLEKVEKLVKAALPVIAKKFTAVTEEPEYLGLVEFTAHGLTLRVTAKCTEENRIQLSRDINREFKLLLDKNKIKMAVQPITSVK